MNADLQRLLTAVLAFAEKHPGEAAPALEQALVAAYRNGLVDAARSCQELMRRQQTIASATSQGQRELYEADAAAHAAFECSELILDRIITVDATLRGVP